MTLRQKRYWFSITVSLVLIILLSVVTIHSFNYFSRETIREQGRMAAELLRISLTEQMRTGVINEREILFKRLRTIPGLVDVRVARGQPVIQQFGPGEIGDRAQTDMERRVLATGNWEEEFITKGGTTTYRLTIPYIATSAGSLNCLECHDVSEGAINGAVTLGFSLENMNRAEFLAIMPIVALLMLFGIALGYFLKRLFEPMVATADSLKKVVAQASAGDFTGRIESKSKDEIGEIAEQTNRLLETLDQTMGRIAARIQSLGGRGAKRHDTHNVLDHTVRIVNEMVGATRFKQAVENDLDIGEIYDRIHFVLTEHFDLKRFSYYQVDVTGKHMEAVFVEGLRQSNEIWCESEILTNAETCRAKRTAACVSSIDDPNICPRFCGESKGIEGLVHVCAPMMLSGRVGGILQIVMTPEEAAKRIDVEQSAQIYLNQAAPVIETRLLMQSLKDSAMRDPMTGLYNRRFLEDYIDNMMASLNRQKGALGVLMCDVDFFKKVNDEYGHDVGDEIIKGLAEIIKQTVRESDMAVRFGGEEFIVLLPYTDPAGSHLLAERLRKGLESHTFQTAKGPLKKTLSVGYAMFPEDGKAFWECVKYADIALYKAKEGGRNQTKRFSPDMWEEGKEY